MNKTPQTTRMHPIAFENDALKAHMQFLCYRGSDVHWGAVVRFFRISLKKWDKTIKISIVSNFFLKKYFFNRSKVPENLYFSLSGPKTLIPRVNF